VLSALALTLTIGVFTPLATIATILVLPFSDRGTQAAMTLCYFAHLFTLLQVVA
jgi:hypothetical protein